MFFAGRQADPITIVRPRRVAVRFDAVPIAAPNLCDPGVTASGSSALGPRGEAATEATSPPALP
jgi:hypothetical protein